MLEYNKFEKCESLQSLRAIAYICIFLHHSSLSGMGPLGPFGVSLFIIMSGFLMGAKYIGNNVNVNFGFKFVIRKMKKLYPLHIIMTFLFAVYYYFTEGFYVKTWIIGLVSNILMVQNYMKNIPMQTFNGVSWYLSVSVITYFLFPLILKVMKKYKHYYQAYIGIFLAFLFIAIISFIAKLHNSDEIQKYITYNFPLMRLPEFIFGCNVGYLYVCKDLKKFLLKQIILFFYLR